MLDGNLRTTRNISLRPVSTVTGTLALALSGVAVTLMTADRAAQWAGVDLVLRRLSPTPIVEYGVAHLKDNTSLALLNLLGIVEEAARPLPEALPEGCELIWIPQELARPAGYSPGG